MTRIIALLAFVLTTSTAFAIDIKDEIILEWSSGLVYRWYCLGEKEGTLNAEEPGLPHQQRKMIVESSVHPLTCRPRYGLGALLIEGARTGARTRLRGCLTGCFGTCCRCQ